MFVQPLTYAYDTQVCWRTNTSPYRFLLSRQSSVPWLLTARMNVPSDSSDDTSPQAMRPKIRLLILALRSKINAHACKLQKRYKHNFERRVRETQVVTSNDYVFVNNPLLKLTAHSSAEAISKQEYNKLQHRTARPFRIITVREKTLKIDENGIPKNVSMDRVAHALQKIITNRHPSQEKLWKEIPLKLESSQKDTSQEQEFIVAELSDVCVQDRKRIHCKVIRVTSTRRHHRATRTYSETVHRQVLKIDQPKKTETVNRILIDTKDLRKLWLGTYPTTAELPWSSDLLM